MRPSAAALAVAAFVAVAAAFLVVSRESQPPPIGQGQTAAAFDLPSLGGGPRVRLADLRGKVVLLNFWATWCKPCEDEMPSMERLARQLAGQPFALLAVSVDATEAEVTAFRDRLGLTLPILFDPEKKVASAYQAFRFPETVLIDTQGNVAGRFIGPREWDAPVYVEKIQELIRSAQGG